MTTRWWVSTIVVFGLAAAAAGAQAPAQIAAAPQVRLLVGDQSVLEPGFPVGDIAIGDPAIADFRVRAGRRSVLVLGIGEGHTKLILWDQAGKVRSETEVIVETRDHAEAETRLRTLLRDFPSVTVERVGSGLIVTGSVSSQDDLSLIERMASSSSAESFVRYVPPEGGAAGSARPSLTPGAAVPPPANAADRPVAEAPAAAPHGAQIEYQVEVMEASVAFGSSSYETGIEPSGRVLHTATLRTGLAGDAQTFIPGKVLASKDIKIPPKELETSGIRLTLTPTALEEGRLSTRIFVETNLPVKSSAYVPGGWRRARWQAENDISAAFSIAGADLLVVPELSSGGGTLAAISEGTSRIGGLPGVSNLPGGRYSSYVPYYNKDRKTQLLVLMRARFIPAGQ